MKTSDPSVDRSLNTTWLFVIVFVVGSFAGWMQQRLYRHHQPFFDSLSYYQKLDRVMVRSAGEGWSAGFDEVLTGHNTIALPYLLAIPLADWVVPSRLLAVGFQSGLLLVFLLLWDYWLREISQISRGWRLMLCLSVFALHNWYYPNGGLTDFRMDLSLMLWYAIVSICFMKTLRDTQWTWAFATGLALGLACLCRGTAPVYFAVGLVPIGLAALWASPNRRKLLQLAASTIGVAAIVSGWFYVLNWEYLRYYYVDWNTDANKKLELWQAFGHVPLGLRPWSTSGVILVVASTIIARLEICQRAASKISTPSESFASTIAPAPSFSSRWLLCHLWLGFAPLILLVTLRAGLNPYVVWPASLMLFLTFQLTLIPKVNRLNSQAMVVLGLLLAISLSGSVLRGWVKHVVPERGQMKLHQDVIDQVLDDARARNRQQIRISTLMATEISAPSLLSVLTFDRADAVRTGKKIELQGVAVSVDALYFLPAQVDWNNVPGNSDSEKADTLAKQAVRRIDYLLVPTAETVLKLIDDGSDVIVHRHLAVLSEKLFAETETANGWTLITENIRGGDGNRYHLYRNETFARYANVLPLPSSQY